MLRYGGKCTSLISNINLLLGSWLRHIRVWDSFSHVPIQQIRDLQKEAMVNGEETVAKFVPSHDHEDTIARKGTAVFELFSQLVPLRRDPGCPGLICTSLCAASVKHRRD